MEQTRHSVFIFTNAQKKKVFSPEKYAKKQTRFDVNVLESDQDQKKHISAKKIDG